MDPLIINAAVSGSRPITTTPHLPTSPESIAENAIECWRQGAAIVHIHARDEEGVPSGDPRHFGRVQELVREAGSDVLLNFTTSFSSTSGDDQALRMAPLALGPELASFDAGTLNVGSKVFVNTPDFLRELAVRMRDHGVKPEIEIFDAGWLGNVRDLQEAGLLAPPLFIQFVLGIPGGAAPTPESLLHLVDQLPEGAVWSVAALGRNQLPFDAMAIAWGGHARTGLEDNIYLRRGVLATNGQLVERVRRLAEIMERPVATPAEARAILAIPAAPVAS